MFENIKDVIKYNLAGSDDSKDGRVIMNKLHRFLRQRSAPASGSPPPTISITKNEEENNVKNSTTLTVPLLSKSEGRNIRDYGHNNSTYVEYRLLPI